MLQIPKEKTHFSGSLAPRPKEDNPDKLCNINSEKVINNLKLSFIVCSNQWIIIILK